MVSPNHIPVSHAHATVSSLAWGIILPLGAILIRLVPSKKAWIIHAGVMLFGLSLFTAGFGTGLWSIFDYGSTVKSLPHAIIGTTVFSLAWAQPFTGLGHHFQFRIERKRTFLSALHIFVGRVLIVLGIINGGLGFQVNEKDSTQADRIIYGTLGGVIACCYLGASFWFEARRENVAMGRGSGAATPVVGGGEGETSEEERESIEEKGEKV